jgi:hypothetical protein
MGRLSTTCLLEEAYLPAKPTPYSTVLLIPPSHRGESIGGAMQPWLTNSPFLISTCSITYRVSSIVSENSMSHSPCHTTHNRGPMRRDTGARPTVSATLAVYRAHPPFGRYKNPMLLCQLFPVLSSSYICSLPRQLHPNQDISTKTSPSNIKTLSNPTFFSIFITATNQL